MNDERKRFRSAFIVRRSSVSAVHHSSFFARLPAMLKWVMRVVPVGGALLAMAVGTAAWRHRTQGRLVGFVTPTIWSGVIISPRHAFLEGWLRRDWEPDKPWYVEKYGALRGMTLTTPTRRLCLGTQWTTESLANSGVVSVWCEEISGLREDRALLQFCARLGR